MSDPVVIEAGEVTEAWDQQKAIEVGKVLETHYPGHPWVVMFQGHVLVVRHMELDHMVSIFNQFRPPGETKIDGMGYVISPNELTDPKRLEKAAMRAGGAILEISQLPRGGVTDKIATAPREWQRKTNA